mgnify:CR=1 FL=1
MVKADVVLVCALGESLKFLELQKFTFVAPESVVVLDNRKRQVDVQVHGSLPELQVLERLDPDFFIRTFHVERVLGVVLNDEVQDFFQFQRVLRASGRVHDVQGGDLLSGREHSLH